MKLRLRAISAIVGSLTLGVSGFALAAPALAGSNYDGSDPYSTGCANSAYSVSYSHLFDSNGSQIGTTEVQLYYSPACRTAWAVVTGGQRYYVTRSSSGTYTYHGTKASISNNSRYPNIDPAQNCYVGQDNGWCYTLQINDAGLLSRAVAQDYEPPAYYSGQTRAY